MSSTYDKGKPHVIIVGAGLAGISAAIGLKRQLGFENFTIYDKGNDIGGTWRDNTYPGCGSDVGGHWYSLSTDLNPRWSSYFVNQPEIRAYWVELHHKYDLAAHTVLGTAVHSSVWDPDAQLYHVVLEEVETGARTETEAQAMIYAIGGFMSPMYPKDVPGADTFHGHVWHSARWNHDVALTGKRIGVIGNGCSAAQFIPEISVDPSVEVVNFCRTPQWFIPRGNYRYAGWIKWVFAHVPFVMRWYRNFIMARADIGFLLFRKDNKRLIAFAKRMMTAYVRKHAPKEQWEKLIPDYPPGCKRLIVDPGYLAALRRPNVHVRWDSIECVIEEGIKLKNGEVVPLDIIIFGTGYSVEPTDLRAVGRGGTSIHEYFESKGGPTAYVGSCIPGFPNLFVLLGPNVASGHASVIFSQEAQIQHALQLIKPILDGEAQSFEISDEATDKYNAWLEGRLASSVWIECHSYYQVATKTKTKIVATFPGPVALFWWLTRAPRWERFHTVGAEGWKRHRKMNAIKKWVVMSGTIMTMMSVGLMGRAESLRSATVEVLKRLLRVKRM